MHLLAFDYGQRHRKELAYAECCARHLEATIVCRRSPGRGPVPQRVALTDAIPVPDGHYAAPNMTITVVPNRNAIMLSVAYGVAVAERAEVVAIGVHAGDHFIYPDCRPAFIEAFQAMQKVAVEGSGEPKLRLDAPFLHLSKQQIVKLGTALGVPFADTWSCYKGGERHCGTCGTCYERKEAFELAEEPDPTDYEG